MSDEKIRKAEVANLLGVIERMAGDLSLAEEPSRFIAALDGDATPAAPGAAPSR